MWLAVAVMVVAIVIMETGDVTRGRETSLPFLVKDAISLADQLLVDPTWLVGALVADDAMGYLATLLVRRTARKER